MSRGASSLFHLIHRLIHRGKLGRCEAGQAWLASKLAQSIRASIRSVKRWLAELVAGGFVKSIRRPNRTSVYEILKELAPPMAPPMAPPVKEEPSGLTPSERKPASRAWSHFRQLPNQTIQTPGGRTILNPEWQACRDALRASHDAISRARNREAYVQAIVERVRLEWSKTA
jgi:hypothetical protein